MTDICGSVEQLLPRTYYWNLETKAWYIKCSSENFTIVSIRGEKYKLSLHLSDYDPHTGAAYLEMSCRERCLLYLDAKVNLHYANNSFEFSMYDFYVWTEKHKLRIVNVEALLGITCSLSNIRVRFKGSDESDGNASKDAPIESSQNLSPIQDEESKCETEEPVKTRDGNASKDAQVESSENFSRIQAKESHSETDEPVKTRGLLALSGNLKDVFLDEEDSDVILNVGNHPDKASVDITGESSKKRKHEESSTIEEKSSAAEQNKRINTRGLDALSGNLKDAFLSAEDTDVVIKVGEKEYRAHKVILKNRSPVFYSMLKYDMIEKNQGIIDISDCDPDIFHDFLLYLYTGKVDSMSKGNVFELYYMSDKYGVELLKLDCVDFILNNLDLDIICDVIALATRHLEREVLKHAISFFTDNAKEIFLTSNWQKFIKEYPIQANELIIKAFNKKS